MLTRLESFKVHSPLQTQEKWGQLYQAHANKVPSIFDLKLLLIVLMENDILTDQTNSKRWMQYAIYLYFVKGQAPNSILLTDTGTQMKCCLYDLTLNKEPSSGSWDSEQF